MKKRGKWFSRGGPAVSAIPNVLVLMDAYARLTAGPGAPATVPDATLVRNQYA